MVYFLKLCGRKITPRTLSDAETSSEPSLKLENPETDQKDPNIVDNTSEPHLQLNNNNPVLESIASESMDRLEFSQQECGIEHDALHLEDDESMNAEDESEEEGRMFLEIFDAVEDNLPESMLELENPEEGQNENVGDVLPASNLQLENTEPEQNDNISARTLTDDSEEGVSMFFEIFESLAESFFAQIDDTRSSHDLDAVIGTL